jgi:MFS family permease
MVVRHETAPIYGVNDIVVQQEAAIRYFVHGKNPYKETYFGTPVETFHYSDTEINPALYHFVMEPGYLLLPLPLYTLSNHVIGYFDSREVLWLLFAGMLLLAYAIPKEREDKRLFVILLAFNPATLGYVLEGRSDVFVYFFLFATFFLLEKKRFFWSSLLLAISFLIKQSAWPLLPLYAVYLVRYAWYEKILSNKFISLFKNFIGFIVLFLGVSAPFYFWNPEAYIASTISYLSGATSHSYPVSGYGFGMVLNQLGFIKDINAYYPFTLWQIGVGLPILAVLSWYLWKKPTVQKLILFYAIFLFVFWYFSRYFNNSHVGYISMVLITGYFWRKEN